MGTFSGIPTKAGIYNVFVTGWEEEEYSSPGSDHLEISFYIRESGPQIIQQPNNQVVDWGDVLTLSVVVRNPETVSYQWEKDGKPILNANAATLQIIQTTSADSGVYQVVTSNELGETVSDDVFGFVTSSELQKWREEIFVDPFDPVADPTADPDLDGKPNNLEFVLGEDPLSGITLGYPKVSYQELEGLSYLVCEFKENPFTSDVVPLLEKKTDLSEAEWRSVNLEETSIIAEETIEHFRLFFLIDGPTFLRLRLIAE